MTIRIITNGFGDGFPSIITLGFGGEISQDETVYEIFLAKSIVDFELNDESKISNELTLTSTVDVSFNSKSEINLRTLGGLT